MFILSYDGLYSRPIRLDPLGDVSLKPVCVRTKTFEVMSPTDVPLLPIGDKKRKFHRKCDTIGNKKRKFHRICDITDETIQKRSRLAVIFKKKVQRRRRFAKHIQLLLEKQGSQIPGYVSKQEMLTSLARTLEKEHSIKISPLKVNCDVNVMKWLSFNKASYYYQITVSGSKHHFHAALLIGDRVNQIESSPNEDPIFFYGKYKEIALQDNGSQQ
jgi:hypothetical protein